MAGLSPARSSASIAAHVCVHSRASITRIRIPFGPALRVLLWLSTPDTLHAVSVEGLVSADDGKTFDQGLRDDQTVEGIAVVKGHDCHLADVGDVKRKHGDAVLA